MEEPDANSTVFLASQPRREGSIRHPSLVVMIGEVSSTRGNYYTSGDILTQVSMQNGVRHSNTANLLFVDGHSENMLYADLYRKFISRDNSRDNIMYYAY